MKLWWKPLNAEDILKPRLFTLVRIGRHLGYFVFRVKNKIWFIETDNYVSWIERIGRIFN